MAIEVAEEWSKCQFSLMEAMESMYKSHSMYAGGGSRGTNHPNPDLRHSKSSTNLLNELQKSPSPPASPLRPPKSASSHQVGGILYPRDGTQREAFQLNAHPPSPRPRNGSGTDVTLDFRHSVDIGSMNRPNRLMRMSSANDDPITLENMSTAPELVPPAKLGNLPELLEDGAFGRYGNDVHHEQVMYCYHHH